MKLFPCRRFRLPLATSLLILATALGTVASARADTSPAATLAGHPDRGTYRFYLNEEVLVTTTFSQAPDGAYESSYTLAMAGQTATVGMRIAVDGEGRWTSIDLDSPQGKVGAVRRDTTVTITLPKQTNTVHLKPNTVLFENFNPAFMAQAVRAYDEAKGGKQPVSIFLVPAAVAEGSLERLDPIERTLDGRDLVLARYRYGLPGVDVILHVDLEGRVVFGDVPAQHGAYVREGYEGLLAVEEPDSLLSRPEFEVDVISNVRVPMRDGIQLATDIYRPRTGDKVPVILVRTPYKKEMNELQGRFFARRGFAYAVQDVRGRFTSPGTWEPFMHEAADGYDTVEWLAREPWSTGKIGMIGASYLGWVQWWAARDRPPHLTTIIPNVSPPDPFFNIPYEYGVFFLLGSIWWADILESEATGDLSGKAFQEIGDKKYALLLRHLPVIELDTKVLGKENAYWRKWIEHPILDSYWEPANFLDHLKDLDIPVFHQSGWFDGDGIGSKLNYLRMRDYGHKHQKLVLGPWGHSDTATRRIGDHDFGPQAILDLQRQYLRWLDRWLKGVENGIEKEPLVSVFAMGSNRWYRANDYPLPQTRFTKLYLTSGGGANSSNGDGGLSLEPPTAATPPDRFTYDPGEPTPSPKFYVTPEDLVPEKEGDTTRSAADVEKLRAEVRAFYAGVDSARRDILVYDSEPMTDSLTFVGPVAAVLYASTSAKDTDWFMRLSEIDAGGTIFPLVEGKIRARFRESMVRPTLLDPGKIYKYTLDLWQTGITVPPGHRLRVEVASASFPSFSRNLNTGGHNERDTAFVKAEQTVYHDAERPSHVLLPVLPWD